MAHQEGAGAKDEGHGGVVRAGVRTRGGASHVRPEGGGSDTWAKGGRTRVQRPRGHKDGGMGGARAQAAEQGEGSME